MHIKTKPSDGIQSKPKKFPKGGNASSAKAVDKAQGGRRDGPGSTMKAAVAALNSRR